MAIIMSLFIILVRCHSYVWKTGNSARQVSSGMACWAQKVRMLYFANLFRICCGSPWTKCYYQLLLLKWHFFVQNNKCYTQHFGLVQTSGSWHFRWSALIMLADVERSSNGYRLDTLHLLCDEQVHVNLFPTYCTSCYVKVPSTCWRPWHMTILTECMLHSAHARARARARVRIKT